MIETQEIIESTKQAIEKTKEITERDAKLLIFIKLKEAAMYGYIECMKLLLAENIVDPSVHDNLMIATAISHGRYEIVQTLLKDERVSLNCTYSDVSLYSAALCQWIDIVKLLLQNKNLGNDAINLAIKAAIEKNNKDLLEVLISDERISAEEAMNLALSNQLWNFLYELVRNKRVTLKQIRNSIMMHSEYHNPIIVDMLEKMEDEL